MVQTPIKPSSPKERQETIDWLIAHNYPALPVAPVQDARKHPKIVRNHPERGIWAHCPLTNKLQPIQLYTGKNPSYLDRDGFPHLINHRQYQNQLPRDVELEIWFANPENGVGTLGGWNDTVWLDFDIKQFSSPKECDEAVTSILERVRTLTSTPQQQTLIERSHSGGWRIALKLEQKPNFTNFSLTPGGTHIGEALFTGRFTVLAPTIGPSGNPYQSISRIYPVSINSLSAIGIHPTKKGSHKRNQLDLLNNFSEPHSTPSSIPLEHLGHDTSRKILQGECPTGDRSEAIATAIQEWYGWTNWTRDNGIQISGNTMELTHQAGSLLGLDTDRISRILDTIDPTSCQPSALYRGGEKSCWQKIYQRDKATFEAKCPPHIKDAIFHFVENVDGNKCRYNSELADPKSPPKTTDILTALSLQIKNILTLDLPPSELVARKIQIRRDFPGVSEREISKLFETLEEELDWEEAREHRRQEVDNLLKLTDQSLNIRAFLPADLAQPLEALSSNLNIRPEVCLTSLLVAVSSLHKTSTELVIHRGQGFSVPPTIFAGLVSESGQKKSPILKAIIKNPLAVLQRENRLAFEEALSKYDSHIADWDRCSLSERSRKFPDGKPKKPQQRLYYFTNSTGEGLLYQFQAHPDKGLLALVDELVGLFASQNKYSGGRGSDRQDILSAFDGTGATILRAAGTKADIEGLSLSICGTIQPEVLKRLMRDCSDPDGQWARFLFVNQPLAAATLSSDDGGGLDLTGRLLNYYRAIDRLPAREYRLSKEAFKHYQPVYNQLEQLRVSHPLPGMRAVYSKMEGYIGRLALNLHVLHELSKGKTLPDEEIPLQPLLSAVALAKFYIGQVKLIHANCSTDVRELGPHLAKIVELSKRMEATTGNSWIKAKAVQSGYDSRHRPRPDAIRSWFRELEALALGGTRGSGIRLEYSWKIPDIPLGESPQEKTQKVEKSGEKWITSPLAESMQYQGIQEKVEKEDTVPPSLRVVQEEKAAESGLNFCKASSLLPLVPGISQSPTKNLNVQLSCEGIAHTALKEAYALKDSILLPSLLSSSSFLERNVPLSPLSEGTNSLFTCPLSTSPLFVCDDAMARQDAVDIYSPKTPLVATLSTFSVKEIPAGITPSVEPTEPSTYEPSLVTHVAETPQFMLISCFNRCTWQEWQGMTFSPPCIDLQSVTSFQMEIEPPRKPAVHLSREFLLPLKVSSNQLVTAHCSLNTVDVPAFTFAVPGEEGKSCDTQEHRLLLDRCTESESQVQNTILNVGEHVYWSQCPAHCEQFAPFEITAIDGNHAKLDLFEKPVLLSELHRSRQTTYT